MYLSEDLATQAGVITETASDTTYSDAFQVFSSLRGDSLDLKFSTTTTSVRPI